MDCDRKTLIPSKRFRSTHLRRVKSVKRSRYGKRKKRIVSSTNQSNVEFPKVWSELREDQQFLDGILKCNDEVFHVHRLILSLISPYFNTLFTKVTNGNISAVNEIQVDDISTETMKLILDYAYTGSCCVTKDNVWKLLPVADKFEVLGVMKLCCEILINDLKPENCIGIFKIAEKYFCQDLKRFSWIFMLHNFMASIKDKCLKHFGVIPYSLAIVQRSSELSGFEDKCLITLLKDDQLNVQGEEMVFWCVKLWIEAKEEIRAPLLPLFLKCIRFGLMESFYFNNIVMKWDLIKENEECKAILQEASILLSKVAEMKELSPNISTKSITADLHHPLTKPRIPYEILFAIGGWSSGSPTNFIETYDIRSDHWFLLSNTDSTPRAYHGIVSFNGLIYMIGGFDGSNYFSSMSYFDPIQKNWTKRACMYYARCYISTCILDGKIYALGGYDGISRMKSVERYTPEFNQWELITPMNSERSDASAASLNGKVYIVGGFSGQDVLDSAEVYDPHTNQWTYIRQMGSARSGVCLTVYRNCLYAIGGFDGTSRLNSVEYYDPYKGFNWRVAPEMINPRSNFAVAILDGKLFVIGGFCRKCTIQDVEFYSEKSNQWEAASPMNLNRSALGVCVMRGLKNAKEYSYISKVNFHGDGYTERRETYL